MPDTVRSSQNIDGKITRWVQRVQGKWVTNASAMQLSVESGSLVLGKVLEVLYSEKRATQILESSRDKRQRFWSSEGKGLFSGAVKKEELLLLSPFLI